MRSSRQFVPFFTIALLLVAAAADAAHIDMSEPRRALAREDDVRIDAQLMQDTLGPNSTVSVTCEIENLSNNSIAIADRVTDVTFDPNEQAINLSIGAEVPNGKSLPHLVVIAPGQKTTFRAGGTVHGVANVSGPFAVVPRTVQIRVNVLRDLTIFGDAIAKQTASAAASVALTNDMFDKWLDSNDSISLNALPVRWNPHAAQRAMTSAEEEAVPNGGSW